MIKSRSTPQNPSSNLVISGGESAPSFPFKTSIVSLDDTSKECSVLVALNSHVLKSQNILDFVDILGKNLKLSMPYGHKIWLETLFDANRVPVVGFIKTGPKWPAKVKNSSGALQDVYPNCEEFISRDDIAAKAGEIDALITYVSTLKGLSEDELEFQHDNGIITQSEYQVLLSKSGPAFDRYRTVLAEYKAGLSKFFVAAPSNSWKKLFRLYSLIAYTTKDLSGNIAGNKAFFSNQGSPITPAVPQAVKSNDYRVVQCLNSDLILQDSWYNNSYPSKIMVPYNRGVHTFYDGQQTEEDKNA